MESGEVPQLPNDIKTLSLRLIAEDLNIYYSMVSGLIHSHYSGDYSARDDLFKESIVIFNRLFQRVRGSLDAIYKDPLYEIEQIILIPNYDDPDDYIPNHLRPAFITFNRILSESGLDNLIQYENPIYHTHKTDIFLDKSISEGGLE